MLSQKDIQQVRDIVSEEVAKALAQVVIPNSPPTPTMPRRRYGRRSHIPDPPPLTPEEQQKIDEAKQRLRDQEQRLVAAIRAFEGKRQAWLSEPEDNPPGDWYFGDFARLVILAAETKPMPASWDHIYRRLFSAGRSLAKAYIKGVNGKYPGHSLVQDFDAIYSDLGKFDFEANTYDGPEEAFDDFPMFQRMAAALKAALDRNNEPCLALIHDMRLLNTI